MLHLSDHMMTICPLPMRSLPMTTAAHHMWPATFACTRRLPCRRTSTVAPPTWHWWMTLMIWCCFPHRHHLHMRRWWGRNRKRRAPLQWRKTMQHHRHRHHHRHRQKTSSIVHQRMFGCLGAVATFHSRYSENKLFGSNCGSVIWTCRQFTHLRWIWSRCPTLSRLSYSWKWWWVSLWNTFSWRYKLHSNFVTLGCVTEEVYGLHISIIIIVNVEFHSFICNRMKSWLKTYRNWQYCNSLQRCTSVRFFWFAQAICCRHRNQVHQTHTFSFHFQYSCRVYWMTYAGLLY